MKYRHGQMSHVVKISVQLRALQDRVIYMERQAVDMDIVLKEFP